jgi:hypothetical protein
LIWIVLVYLNSGASIFQPSSFMGVKGIGPYLAICILFAANPKRFLDMRRTILLLGVILTLGGMYNMINIGLGFGRMEGQMNLRLIAVNLAYLSPFILFNNFQRNKLLSIIIFGFSFIFSLLIVTRSFILIHIIVLLFFMRYMLKKKVFGYSILLLIALLFLFMFLDLELIQYSITLLSERGDEDSRSLQIIQFFAGIDLNSFYFGEGVYSTWKWGRRDYQWLDNQVLLTAWWAGVLPILGYLILYLKGSLKYLFKRKVNELMRGNALIVFLWVLGLFGFGIYISISTDLYHFLMCFMLGSLLYPKKS